jgi:hypothetical protein
MPGGVRGQQAALFIYLLMNSVIVHRYSISLALPLLPTVTSGKQKLPTKFGNYYVIISAPFEIGPTHLRN